MIRNKPVVTEPHREPITELGASLGPLLVRTKSGRANLPATSFSARVRRCSGTTAQKRGSV